MIMLFKLKITTLLCFIFFSAPILAQSIKLKDKVVFLDGKEIFKYKIENNSGIESITLMDLTTNEEVIFIKEDDGGTFGPKYRADDFTIYIFLKEKIRVEVSSFDFWKNDIKFLYKQNVFDSTGKLNQDKILLFKEKFDENITEKRTKRQ